MEHDERESTGTTPSATRSQHVVYTLPHDWGTIPQFLTPALERLDRAAGETQLLVVTPDAETALAVADAALAPRAPRDVAAEGAAEGVPRPAILPVTSTARAERLLRVRPAPAIAGAADALGALVRSAVLKLDTVRAVILAWPDAAPASAAAALEAVLAEVPREAARTLVVSEITPEVEALIERSMWRARRVTPAAGGGAEAPVPVHVVLVAPSARPAALRRLLDELDPTSAAVVALTDASAAEARRTLRALGYPGGADGAGADDDPATAAATAFGPDVPVTAGDVPAGTELVILYDVPVDRALLDRAVAGRPRQVVALAQPRQIGALTRLAGVAPRPLVLGDLARRARARDEAVRAEIRAALAEGHAERELLALEPLLDEHDALEIAAAALRVLERERAASGRIVASTGTQRDDRAAGGSADSTGARRVFLTVGSRDGVRPGDLVGAITGEAGITSDRIGKIEVRESHSLVEIAAADVERVVERVNGISIRGRRVVARTEREGRGDRGDRGDRPERRGFGAGGGGRGAGRPAGGDRPERGDRPPRPPRGDRPAARGPRTFDAQREGPRGFGAPDDRDVRERAEQRGEWADRAERLRRARRATGGSDADATDATDAAGGEARDRGEE